MIFWTLIVAPATGIIPNQSDVCLLLGREKHLSRHHSQVGANQSFYAISFWHLQECDAHLALFFPSRVALVTMIDRQ